MKCDQVLSGLQTGGIWKRIRARRHAASCPNCAGLQQLVAEIRRDLARAEPLSTSQRDLWDRAIEPGIERPSRATARLALMGAAAGLLLSVTVGVGYWIQKSQVPPPVRHARAPTKNDESLQQVTEMRTKLLALSDELEHLRRLAVLLDERKQVDALLQQHAQPEITPKNEP